MKRAWHLAWLPLLAGTGPAHAHSPIPGIEGFYTGLLHPFSTPAQALLMVGLGLFIGGFDARGAVWQLGLFLLATLLGAFAAGMVVGSDRTLDVAMFAAAFLACAWFALAPGKLMQIAILPVVVGGAMIGMESMPDPGPARDMAITLAGSLVGANLGLVYLFGIQKLVTERYPQDWIAIAFRVLGAWLAAISLLMLALRLAPANAV